MHVILTHENADFDAIASLLGAHKLIPRAVPVLPERLNRNVTSFLTLYQGEFAFVPRADVFKGAKSKRVTRVTVVDTRRASPIKGMKPTTPTHIIDHHPNDGIFAANETFDGEITGANATLLIERMKKKAITLSSLEATLLALGIYEDTGSLSYPNTTARDARAAAWLIERGADLDQVRRFLQQRLNDEQQALFEILMTLADTRRVDGYVVTVAAVEIDHYVEELSAIAVRLRDALDSTALFLLASMPREGDGARIVQIVCRSTDDAIDVGEIAAALGGGGHARAASAATDQPLERVIEQLWQHIKQNVRPAVRVGDLMSRGVQTISAAEKVSESIGRLRRLGHEGFPVVENGRVVGLLTRRQADRAVDHALTDVTVREVMSAGNIALAPDAPVALLENMMVESGWGQIPIVENDQLIGIVTRTDLIAHWAKSHHSPKASTAKPDAQTSSAPLTPNDFRDVVGEPTAALIDVISRHADDKQIVLYLVGGIVRDVLLKRPNFDIDFVIEGDAIQFAESLRSRCGGDVTSFAPFGTAKWQIDDAAADKLSLTLNAESRTVDFAAARREHYEYPTALPTVERGGIKLDLARRDFSINTLAVQTNGGRFDLIDEFGGLRDLRDGMIRVLHSLSFIDDPTRILRASRFEHRFGFTIEPRTLELLHNALPMLRRITGERIRNEITLLLQEDQPEIALKRLNERGILSAIHPAFRLDEGVRSSFAYMRTMQKPAWIEVMPAQVELYWHVLMCFIPLTDLPDVCKRLLISGTLAESLYDAAQLVQTPGVLADPKAPRSQITAFLENKILDTRGDLGLWAAYIVQSSPTVRINIHRYASVLRHVKPTTTGATLQAKGLKPGKCFGVLLNRLRAARLDRIVTTDEQEAALLDDLIQNKVCDDLD